MTRQAELTKPFVTAAIRARCDIPAEQKYFAMRQFSKQLAAQALTDDLLKTALDEIEASDDTDTYESWLELAIKFVAPVKPGDTAMTPDSFTLMQQPSVRTALAMVQTSFKASKAQSGAASVQQIAVTALQEDKGTTRIFGFKVRKFASGTTRIFNLHLYCPTRGCFSGKFSGGPTTYEPQFVAHKGVGDVQNLNFR